MNRKLTVRSLVYVAFFTALTAVSSYISIPVPFSQIPFTAQTLAVMLTGLLLPPYLAGVSMIIYLLLGSVGIPVFAGGEAGLAKLVGPTGGFLIGFLLAVFITSLLKGKVPNLLRYFIVSIIAGIFIVHVVGVLWFNNVTQLGIIKSLSLASLPYLPFDLVKAFIASTIGVRLAKHINI